MTDIDAARREAILSSGAGFPFLFAFGISWLAAGALSYVLARETAAWVYLLQGVAAMPVAFILQKVLGYPRASPTNPLTPLALQIVFIQPVAFPAFILVLSVAPAYVPVAFACVVGAHFLPFQWLHQSRVYGVLGVAVSVGSYVLAIVFGQASFHYTGFYVGACLLGGAMLVRLHARAVADHR